MTSSRPTPGPAAGGHGGCLHEVIEAIADAHPGACAIEAPGARHTYADLERAANAVARDLRAQGVARGTLVGLYGPTSVEMIIGLVAILKAGGAWLPLAPSDPPARLATVLADAQPALVLATEALAGEATALGRPVRTVTDRPPPLDSPRPAAGSQPDDPAYVLFTSGSTGRPKGVVIEHRNIVNYCRWVSRANRVRGRVAPLPAITRLTFDASMQQVLAPLLRGDAVWLVEADLAHDPERLLDVVGRREGAGLHCVPALWEELLLLMENGAEAPRLSSLFLGGDVVRGDLWERTRRLLAGTELANVYGPTETTVQATGGFQPAGGQPGAPPGVGRPVDGVRVYIRDGAGGLAPPGEPGEVYIGGAGVGRGYLRRPELTAECFLDGAAIGWPEAGRLYRSADEGILEPDGSLRILGRLDDQLKVGGYRIEPGEVQAALLAQEQVRAAVVIGVDRQLASQRLRAAVVLRTPSADALAAVRDGLARVLPDYLMPTEWQVYDRLPLTPSGKIDKRRIAISTTAAPGAAAPGAAAPGAAAPGADAAGHPGHPGGHRAPDNPAEELVAAVWADVLGCPVRSSDDDFFDLGGNSLLATRVVARLRRAFGVKATLPLLFDHRTVRDLAEALRARLAADRYQPDDQPPVAVRYGPAPLSLQQEAIWATESVLAGTPFNTMLLPVRLSGPVSQPDLGRALDEVVARHPALRTRLQVRDGAVSQAPAPAEQVPVPELDLRDPDPARARTRAVRQALRLLADPLDLRAGPVLRTRLLHLDDDEWVLLIAVHHLVCDGVSFGVILEDLAQAYARHRADAAPPGEPSGGPDTAAPLPRPDYGDYAAWQRSRFASGGFADTMVYWRDKLSRPVRQLRPGPAAGTGRASLRYGAARIVLDPALTARLRAYAQANAATPFMCLTATVAFALHRRHGGEVVRLATLVANREIPELERAVGAFATTVLLDLAVEAGTAYQDLVAEARRETLLSQVHQALPLDTVVAATGVPPDGLVELGIAWEPSRPAVQAGGVSFSVFTATEQEAAALPAVPSSTALSVTVREIDATLLLTLEYRRDVLDDDAAAGLLDEVRTGLAQQLAAPERPLREVTCGPAGHPGQVTAGGPQ